MPSPVAGSVRYKKGELILIAATNKVNVNADEPVWYVMIGDTKVGIMPQLQPDGDEVETRWLVPYWYITESDNKQFNMTQSTCEVYANGVACEVPCMVSTKEVKPGEHCVLFFSWSSPSASFVGWPGDGLLLPQDKKKADKKADKK